MHREQKIYFIMLCVTFNHYFKVLSWTIKSFYYKPSILFMLWYLSTLSLRVCLVWTVFNFLMFSWSKHFLKKNKFLKNRKNNFSNKSKENKFCTSVSDVLNLFSHLHPQTFPTPTRWTSPPPPPWTPPSHKWHANNNDKNFAMWINLWRIHQKLNLYLYTSWNIDTWHVYDLKYISLTKKPLISHERIYYFWPSSIFCPSTTM